MTAKQANTLAIIIAIGSIDFAFNATNKDVNKYINNQGGGDTITPSVNFLLSTVAEAQVADLKKTILDEDNVPRGMIVMNAAGLLIAELSGNVKVTVKKSN